MADALDRISAARLANTLEWAQKACREALDLALDAPNNPGLESLEEPADAVAEALRWLIAAAQDTRVLPPATPGVVCPHDPVCRRLDSGWPACVLPPAKGAAR